MKTSIVCNYFTGGGKNKSGGGTVKVTKSKAMQTKAIEEKVLLLRQAIFRDDGKDKDVTVGIAPAFMRYTRNDLDIDIR
jgi:hypothetical protein